MRSHTWTGALAAHARGGSAAFGGWLRTPSGVLVWRSAERVGDVTLRQAVDRGVSALLRVGLAHRASAPQVAIWPEMPLRSGKALIQQAEDAEAVALAESVLPPPPEFAAAGIEMIEPGHYIAHESKDYQVWTRLGVCSCPAFTFGATRTCNHLKAARAVERHVG
ncbi:MAG: hypothetical protein M0Z66_10755 [Thermaerobacter sp.]|nr:hypothetical protein [Thermaerobacter sp.]